MENSDHNSRKIHRFVMRTGKRGVITRAVKFTAGVLLIGMVACALSYQNHVIENMQHHLDEVSEQQALRGHRVRRDVTEKESATTGSAADQPQVPAATTPVTPVKVATQQPTPPTEENTQSRGGVTYVRWGKLTCSGPDTETVYSGAAGGSNSNSEGGASDYLCLPMDPQWGSYNENLEGAGEVYGVEFEMSNFPFIVSVHGPEILRSHNMPCAVCHTKSRNAVLTIPARIECYPGWTKEYHGYLVSGHKQHKGRSMYMCLDQMPDVEPAGYKRDTSAAVFTVDAVCGSLPCPPYFNGRELACTVCTK